jgi:hypothetical protein
VPTASIDFTLASIATLMVVMGAIFGLDMAAEPYITGETPDSERYYQIGRYMLLSRGDPESWGQGGTPSSLGFASSSEPYELDTDKVTRLNPSSAYSVNYSSLWQALGVDDISFHIEVKPLFEATLSLASSQAEGGETIYNFTLSTASGGYPVQCDVSYYLVLGNSTYSSSGSTDSSGMGAVDFTLPGSTNGTALLIGIAESEESIISHDVLPFAHNSEAANAPGAFASLSPLNYTLNVEYVTNATAWRAAILSRDYAFNLTSGGSGYAVPRLLGGGPLVLVLTGVNGSECWAEWVAYPQVPLAVGADMSDDYLVSDVVRVSYVVEVSGGLYRFEVLFRSPAEYA